MPITLVHQAGRARRCTVRHRQSFQRDCASHLLGLGPRHEATPLDQHLRWHGRLVSTLLRLARYRLPSPIGTPHTHLLMPMTVQDHHHALRGTRRYKSRLYEWTFRALHQSGLVTPCPIRRRITKPMSGCHQKSITSSIIRWCRLHGRSSEMLHEFPCLRYPPHLVKVMVSENALQDQGHHGPKKHHA